MFGPASRRRVLLTAGAIPLAARAQPQPNVAREQPFRSALEFARALATRRVSSAEVVDQAIARIEALDSQINAVVVRDFERALTAAREADMALSRGGARPLEGVPITVKESFNVAGLPTTWGLPSARGWQPTEDALLVARLKAAGAIILGKTNAPLLLMDFQSYNDIYGTTRNPWDPTRTPGGSSGGSAASVAAGYVSLELGSDFGGSVRVPAHYCGVYSHKPSLGLLPLRGHGPPRTPALPGHVDLAVAGPFARTADDLAFAINMLAGPDLPESVAFTFALPPPRHADVLSNYRVLLLDTHPLSPTSAAVKTQLQQLADRLERVGCQVERVSPLLPDLTRLAQVYALLMSAFAGMGLPTPIYERARAEAAALPDGANDLAAYRIRGTVLSHRDWLQADGMRRRIQQQWRELFRQSDVVLCPVHQIPAFSHDHSPPETREVEIDGQRYPFRDHLRLWSGLASVPGIPATVAPIGLTDAGLPVGVQIIGAEYEDRTTIEFARLIEREFGGFRPPPRFP